MSIQDAIINNLLCNPEPTRTLIKSAKENRIHIITEADLKHEHAVDMIRGIKSVVLFTPQAVVYILETKP